MFCPSQTQASNCAANTQAAIAAAAQQAQQQAMMQHQFYDLPYRQQTSATLAEQVCFNIFSLHVYIWVPIFIILSIIIILLLIYA